MQPAPIILITGVMASGKSTLAQHLAERLTRSVHLRGDVFRKMVVGGRAEMSSESTAAALSQLQLRYQAAFEAARLYSAAGFTVVYQDTIIGPALAEVVEFYGSTTRISPSSRRRTPCRRTWRPRVSSGIRSSMNATGRI